MTHRHLFRFVAGSLIVALIAWGGQTLLAQVASGQVVRVPAANVFANIGVGVDNPEAPLHIFAGEGNRAPASQTRLFVEDDANATIEIITGNASSGCLQFSDNGGNGRGWLCYSHADDDLHFRASSAEVFRIKGTGSVHMVPRAVCSGGVLGDFCVDSDLNLVCFHNGTDWVQMDDFATVCS